MKKRISFLLVVVLLVNLFAFTASLATTNPGFFPGYDRKYMIDGELSAPPVTFTAEVEFGIEYNYAAAGGTPGSGGAFIGNVGVGANTCRFGVDGGYPYLTWTDSYSDDKPSSYNKSIFAKFDEIPIEKTVTHNGKTYPVMPMYTGEPVVVTIVRDHANEKILCYIDGELKQSLHYKDCLWNYNHDTFLGDLYYSNNVYQNLHDPSAIKLSDYVIGGDNSCINHNYIKGTGLSLNKIGLYSDCRTAQQVKNDYNYLKFNNRINVSDSNLIVYFDFAGCGSWNEDSSLSKEPRTITAIKGGLTAYRNDILLGSKADLGGNVAYTMAFLGDIQKVTRYSANIDGDNPDKVNNLKHIFDWLIDNKEREKIEFVVGLGDITDLSDDREWALAIPEIEKLSAKYGTNYIAIQGNHDRRGTAYTKSSYATDNYDPSKHVAYDDAMNKYSTHYKQSILSEQRMTNPVSGEKDSILNFYKKINICGVPYMFLCLEYGPSNEILAWADEVVENNKNYNVIYVTHGYLADDGTTLDFNDGSSPDGTDDAPNDGREWGDNDDVNNGEEQWHRFVKKHENICMVVSGHVGYDEILITDAVGDNGNVVKQVLIDHQNIDEYLVKKKPSNATVGYGIVSLMHFMGDGRSIKTETIATIMKASNYFWYNFGEFNRKTFTLDLRGTKGGDFSSSVKGQPDGYCTVADVLYVMEAYVNRDASECDVNADGIMTLEDVTRVIGCLNK